MNVEERARTRRGLAIAAFGGLVLTTDIPLIRLADGNAWSILAARSFATFVAAVAAWAVIRLVTGRWIAIVPGRKGLVVAALYGLASVTFMTAVFATPTANLVFILAFNTMFSALLAWIFLGERPHPVTVAAMVVMIAGVLIIVGDGISAGHLFGDLMALTSSLILASAITISRGSGRDMGFAPLISTILPALIALAATSRTGFVIHEPFWILFNGFIVTPVSFWCLATAPRYIPAPEVAMFYLLETVLAPIWVWLIFSEAPSRTSLAGGALMICALVGHALWQLGRSRTAPAASVAAGL